MITDNTLNIKLDDRENLSKLKIWNRLFYELRVQENCLFCWIRFEIASIYFTMCRGERESQFMKYYYPGVFVKEKKEWVEKYWFENNSKWFMKHFNRLKAEHLFFIPPPPFWQVNVSELVIDGL